MSSNNNNQDVKGEIVKPSIANNPLFRTLSVTAILVLLARSTEFVPAKLNAFIHLSAWAFWTGSTVWVTLIGGITMFKNMPRQMFGRVQAKLFPKYFLLATACTSIMLGTIIFGGMKSTQIMLLGLGISLFSSVVNWLVIDPVATEVLMQRYALENADSRDEQAIKKLYKTFSKYHGIASIFNLIALIGGICHGYYLAPNLV